MTLHHIMTPRPATLFMPNFARMLEEQEKFDRERDRKLRELKLRQLDDPDYWLKRSLGLDWRDDTQESIRAAVATANFPNMGTVVGNTGGAVEALPPVSNSRGRQRTWIDTLVLATQTNGTVIGVARLPLYAVLLAIELITDTSLGTSTIAFGDANSGAIYAAAQTLTSTQTIVRTAATATKGKQITSGYDSVTGNLVTPFMPQTPGEGGAMYEDIVMTIGAANFPASGNLTVMIEYSID